MPEDNGHAGQGPVVLDIGGQIGALVLSMPAQLDGVEIEIRPVAPIGHTDRDQDQDGRAHPLPHVAVRGRPANGRVLHTAVFPQLQAGTYELYERLAGPVRLTVTVRGAEVAYAVWPD